MEKDPRAERLAGTIERVASPVWDPGRLPIDLTVPPELLPKENQKIVADDLECTLAVWKVLTWCDPLRTPDFLVVFKAIRDGIATDFEISGVQAEEPARRIAKAILSVLPVSQRRRVPIRKETKETLVDMCPDGARCWYCGSEFSSVQVDSFRQGSPWTPTLPHFVDFVTGRGTKERHLKIEVDHVRPFVASGTEDVSNLKLSCGWCNSRKSDLRNLFDPRNRLLRFDHPKLGRLVIPLPFWGIRILAIQRECSEVGCTRHLNSEPLRLGPLLKSGALVPGNLGAFCKDHDPYRTERYVPRSLAANSA